MKILKSMPVILLAAFMVTSCGQENSSGGSSSGSSSAVTDFANGIPGSTGTAQTTIEQVRSSFDSKSFGSGLSANSLILRKKVQQSGGFNFNFNFNFGAYNMADDLDIKSIVSANDTSVSLREVTYFDGSSHNIEYGQTSTLSKTSTIYQNMLLRNNNQCDSVTVQAAKIYVTVYENGQGSQRELNGSKIYCMVGGQFGGQSYAISLAIYSDAIPQAANPVYYASQSTTVGLLLGVGNTYINGVQ